MQRILFSSLLVVLALVAVADSRQSSDATAQIEAFFTAVNAADPAAAASFYESGVSEGFRSRRTADENRAFFDRIRNDLGKVTVQSLEVVDPTKAIARASSERMPMPVEFGFDLLGGQIDGISVRIGGPPHGRAQGLDLPTGGSDRELETAVAAAIQNLADDGRFSGVVLLAREGEPFFHRGYGLADREKNRAVTVDTLFDVGSITKLLTRIAIAQLAQAGRLSLADTVADHLPEYPQPDVAKTITIQHLLDHTSGLGDIFNERWAEADKGAFVSPTDFFSLFADRPLEFEPGKRRSYSNAGFIVLGAIVEAAAGRSYANYLERHLFEPAGMTRSGFLPRDGSNPDLAVGYTRGGPMGGRVESAGPVRPNLGMLPLHGSPAGSSSHTAADLLKLDRALRAGTLLDARWTAWVFHSDRELDDASYRLGVAGGGPGVSVGYESDGVVTAIVLANLDPPAGEGLGVELYRALAQRR